MLQCFSATVSVSILPCPQVGTEPGKFADVSLDAWDPGVWNISILSPSLMGNGMK